MNILRLIAQWFVTELLGKILVAVSEAWAAYQKKKAAAEAQAAAIKKHQDNIKKGATDEELSDSFEDVLNNIKPK